MSTEVLLSIKPVFADAIFERKKRFEYRKTLFKRHDVARIFVYSSGPVSKVIGEFIPSSSIVSKGLEELWASTKRYAGISKEYFDSYFQGYEIGHAIKIVEVIPYSVPKSLEDMFPFDRPPQSFRYV